MRGFQTRKNTRKKRDSRLIHRVVRFLFSALIVLTVLPVDAQMGERQLTLQDCIQMALENNLDLQVSSFNPQIAATDEEREKSVFDSQLTTDTTFLDQSNPVIVPLQFKGLERREQKVGWKDRLVTGMDYSIDLVANRDLIVIAGPNLQDSPLDTVYNSSLFFNITQPLLRNRGAEINRTQIHVARNNRLISDSQYRQSVLNTLKEVEEAYWELVFADADFRVRQQSLERAKRFLDENRVKVEVGTLAPIEITTAEAEVASREEDVIVGENTSEDAEDTLRVLLASTDNPLWDEKITPVDRPPFQKVQIDLEEAIQQAMDSRPDLEEQRLRVESDEMLTKFRRNQTRYGLDLTGQYGVQGQIDTRPCLERDLLGNCTKLNPQVDDDLSDTWEQLKDRDFDTWSVALNLAVPIGNREAKSQYTAAKLRRAQSLVNYELLRQEAIREVRRAVRQIETDLRRVDAARVNKRLQSEKLDAEEKKYENGMSTSFQVLEFQEDLAEAERGEIRAIIDFNLSLAELEKVKGTLAIYRGIVIE